METAASDADVVWRIMMNKKSHYRIFIALILGAFVCGCTLSNPNGQSSSLQHNYLVLAKQFLNSELKAKWVKESDQDWEKQMHIDGKSWSTVMGQVVYGKATSISETRTYIFVRLSKDKKIYYEDYQFLIDPETKTVLSVKLWKWDG